MIQKAEILVEQFDEGIIVRWNDASDTEDKVDSSKSLAIKGREADALGQEVWNDVIDIMENAMTEKVLIKLEYCVIKEKRP